MTSGFPTLRGIRPEPRIGTASNHAMAKQRVNRHSRGNGAKPIEILGAIDIPQASGLAPAQPELKKTISGLRHHARRAPFDVREQSGLWLAESYQNVTAVFGRQEDGILTASQGLGAASQVVRSQRRAIGADQQQRSGVSDEGRGHAISKIDAALAACRQTAVVQSTKESVRRVGSTPKNDRADSGANRSSQRA